MGWYFLEENNEIPWKYKDNLGIFSGEMGGGKGGEMVPAKEIRFFFKTVKYQKSILWGTTIPKKKRK